MTTTPVIGGAAWAVLVRIGQPAEELGLWLQYHPFVGNLQGSELHGQQGGMKIPRARAEQRFPGDKGVSERGNSLRLFLPRGMWGPHLRSGP